MEERTDVYDKHPRGMDAYLGIYGWHFSKSMCEWACKNFGKGIMHSKETFERAARHTSLSTTAKGYDAYYMASKLGKLFPDYTEVQIFQLLDRYFKNNYNTAAFTNFWADCQANALPINWEDMI